MYLMTVFKNNEQKKVLMVNDTDEPDAVAGFLNQRHEKEIWVRGPRYEVLIRNPQRVNGEDVSKSFFWFGKPIQD